MALALAYRALRFERFSIAAGTVGISAMILFIILGATTFSQILSFSGATEGHRLDHPRRRALAVRHPGRDAAAADFSRHLRRSGQHDAHHLPVFMPIVQRLDVDLIWFGVLYLICMQLGLLLPPHGLLLMTMKGVAPNDVTMAHIFAPSFPMWR